MSRLAERRVCRVLDRLFAARPLPNTLTLDNGPEFAGMALVSWAVQTAFIESFNGTLRDECLNEHWFLTLQEAPLVIEAWQRDYL